MLGLLFWFGSTVLGLKDASIKFHTKQDIMITDLKEVKGDMKGITRSVIRLELIEEKKLHEYNHGG
jgi:hypothetical protein